ncbi:MAG: CAP domain-containing protein [Thermoleophilia bacterium]
MTRTRLTWLVLSCVVALLLVGTATGARPRPSRTSQPVELQRELFAAINDLRARYDLAELRPNQQLARAAAAHASAMAEGGFFSHSSADGSAFSDRVLRFYRVTQARRWSIGENLLWASPEPGVRRALRMWLESPPHRRALLDPRWRDLGLVAINVPDAPGVFRGLDVTIVVADFGVRS